MKVKTHIKLAELAFHTNISTVPEGFSKFMFNFGLVMIDQSWHVKTHPHYMQKSLGYVIEKVEQLLSAKKFNAYSSMQLGIVVHYLCDFCCNAHISGSVGNISAHIKYELGLQRYLLKNYDFLKDYFSNKSKSIDLNLHNISSVKTSIENVLADYRKGESSYLWDVTQCVELTSIACSSVFNFNMGLSKNVQYTVKQFQT